ncbi:MAG: hypothetical protein NZ898_12455 [Myxococcota bacterium]|nr:hypothetical protein [Myxococcota bacterium]MDW8361369.1 hypothetical protein [Myxococcales bacterium]
MVRVDVGLLRARFEQAMARGRLEEAVRLVEQIERAEPQDGRWPQRRGDLLRRAGRSALAAAAYARAAELYGRQGFDGRAAAIARAAADLDPAWAALATELAARVSPSTRPSRPPAMVPAADDRRSNGRGRFDEGTETSSPLEASELSTAWPATDPAAEAATQSMASLVEAPRVSSDAGIADGEPPAFVDARPAPPTRPSRFPSVRPPPESARGATTSSGADTDASSRLVEWLGPLAASARLSRVEAGSALVAPERRAQGPMVLVEGSARLDSPLARRGGCERVAQGCWLGESSLSGEGITPGRVVAVDSCLVGWLEPAAVAEALSVDPTFAGRWSASVGARLVPQWLALEAFESLPPAARGLLARCLEVVYVASDVTLVDRGRRSEAAWVLLGGGLHREAASIVEPIGPGRVVGVEGLESAEPSTYSVRTTSASLLLRLPVAAFARVTFAVGPLRGMLLRALRAADDSDVTGILA